MYFCSWDLFLSVLNKTTAMPPLLAQSNTLKVLFSHHWIGSWVLLSNYSDLSTIRIWLRLFKEQRKRVCFCFSNVLLGGIIAVWCCTISPQHSLPLDPLVWCQKKKISTENKIAGEYKPFPSIQHLSCVSVALCHWILVPMNPIPERAWATA